MAEYSLTTNAIKNEILGEVLEVRACVAWGQLSEHSTYQAMSSILMHLCDLSMYDYIL